MKYIYFLTALIALYAQTFAQAVTPFPTCGTTNIFFFKNGTNCTEAPYSLNTIALNGTVTNFGTLPGPGKEINAIGLNPADQFAYALTYDRTGSTSPCTFTNTRLVRVDANGQMTELGIVNPPAGGTVSNALGTISATGQFIFYSTVNGDIYIGVIASVQSLSPASSVTTYYSPITNRCPGKQIADWAISPVDGNLYSYAVYNDTVAGTAYKRGIMVKIDINTLELNCMGNINTTELLDPARDNFGGIFFGNDNFMYGVNVNTRKFYRIHPTTGDLVYVSTVPGSGNIRADMGSCTTAMFVLPLQLSNVHVDVQGCERIISWQLGDAHEAKEIVIESSADGRSFKQIATLSNVSVNHFNLPVANSNTYFRISVTNATSGKKIFSPIVFANTNCGQKTSAYVRQNPVTNAITIVLPQAKTSHMKVQIILANGAQVLSMPVTPNTNDEAQLNVQGLTTGQYFARIVTANGEVIALPFTKL